MRICPNITETCESPLSNACFARTLERSHRCYQNSLSSIGIDLSHLVSPDHKIIKNDFINIYIYIYIYIYIHLSNAQQSCGPATAPLRYVVDLLFALLCFMFQIHPKSVKIHPKSIQFPNASNIYQNPF